MNTADLAQRSLRSVWHPCTQMKRHEALPPVAIARAEGPWLYGTDGTRYLDAVSSWWVNLFGHSHPAMRAALADQMATLDLFEQTGAQARNRATAQALDMLLIGGNAEALAVMEGLREQGIWVPAIRPPTVPEGTARLRIALSAAHTDEHIHRLVQALDRLAPASASKPAPMPAASLPGA